MMSSTESGGNQKGLRLNTIHHNSFRETQPTTAHHDGRRLRHYPALLLLLSALALTDCGSKKEVAPPAPKKVTPAPEEAVETTPKFPTFYYNTPAEAFSALLKKNHPSAVGIGELHQTEETTDISSALVRFTEDLLPVAAAQTADLVVETWVSTGACGRVEKQLTKEVDQVTKRPDETENETLRLIKKAVALNIKPHVLEMTCEDYRRIYEADGGTDYLTLLELVGAHLGQKATAARAAREKDKASAKPMTIVYGGALHNDAVPAEMWKRVTFGPSLAATVGPKKYLEIDLVVPEFAAATKVLQNEPWMPTVLSESSTDRTVVIALNDRSYILVLPKSVHSASK